MTKITYTNYILFTLFFICFIYDGDAQLQNSNWYFGNEAGLNFNDETFEPISIADNTLFMPNAAASVSNELGELLFYTNGVDVYNKTHDNMPNGFNIGDDSNSSNVLIVPIPGDSNKYYIFTTEYAPSTGNGLNYSVVDMSLDFGNGDITETTNLLLNTSQKIAVTTSADGTHYWLIAFAPSTNSKKSDTFYTFKIDELGISLSSQYTVSFFVNIASNYEGQMKISPDKNNIALIHNTSALFTESELSVYVLDFDNNLGEVSNINSNLGFVGTNKYYGVEFSPDSNLLYVSEIQDNKKNTTGKIYQVQYRTASPFNTLTTISDNAGTRPIFALQTAIDGKIYAIDSQSALGVINNPNTIGSAANYNATGVQLGFSTTTKGLPSLVLNQISDGTPPDFEFENLRPKILGNPIKNDLRIKFQDVRTYIIEIYNHSSLNMTSPQPIETVIYEDMKNKKVYHVNVSHLISGNYYLIIKDDQSNIWQETVIKIEE